MLTRTQMEEATTRELEALAGRIEAELTRRALNGSGRGEEAGREVVEERAAPRGTYRRELVRCGKERCKKCAEGPAHGPYRYHYFRRDGRLTSRYVGKELTASS